MKKIVMFALAACILAACTPKDFAGTETASATRKVFKAGIENTTRTFVDGLDVCWAEGDAISIFDFNSANSKYVYAGTPGATNGEFEYDSDPGAGDDIDAIYAVYPYSENHIYGAIDDDDWAIWFNQVQEYVAGSFGPGANVMVAKSQTESLMFKNACGYLNLKLYSLNSSAPVSYIEIKGNNSEIISGYGLVTAYEDGDPEVEMLADYGNQNIYVYDPAGELTLSNAALNPTDIWVAIPPVNFTKGITITIYDEDGGRFVQKSSNALEIKRSTVKSTKSLKVQFETMASEDDVIDKLEGTYKVACTSYFGSQYNTTDTLNFYALSEEYQQQYGSNVYVYGDLMGVPVDFLATLYGDQLIIPAETLVNEFTFEDEETGDVYTYKIYLIHGDIKGTQFYFSDDDIIIKVGSNHSLSVSSTHLLALYLDSDEPDGEGGYNSGFYELSTRLRFTYIGPLESPSSSVVPSATIGTPRMAQKSKSISKGSAPLIKSSFNR